MNWLAWIVLYAVALVVFQILVYRYLWTRDEPFERTTPTARPNNDSDGVDDHGRRERRRRDASRRMWVDAQTVGTAKEGICPHCGEQNESEQAYTFCWNCTRRLH